MTTTYPRVTGWRNEISDTGLIRMFPRANRPAEPIRSLLNVLGHFTLLVLGVIGVGITTLSSVLRHDTLLATPPAIIGAYVLLGFVAAGIFRTSFRQAGYGVLYAAIQAAVMIVGEQHWSNGTVVGVAYLALALPMVLLLALSSP